MKQDIIKRIVQQAIKNIADELKVEESTLLSIVRDDPRRVTFKQAARFFGYRTEKSFINKFIESGEIPYIIDVHGRKLVDLDILEKKIKHFQYK